MASSLPLNVHVSKHPCLRAKLSQLRSSSADARTTKALVNEIAMVLGVEALANLDLTPNGTVSHISIGLRVLADWTYRLTGDVSHRI